MTASSVARKLFWGCMCLRGGRKRGFFALPPANLHETECKKRGEGHPFFERVEKAHRTGYQIFRQHC